MADPHPLQAGDRAPNFSRRESSSEADRRHQETTMARSNPEYSHGEHMATDMDRPDSGRLWKVGQAAPNEFLSAPYPVIMMDGDNNGYPAEVHEVDIYSYGDGYDPTSPIRVRTVDNYHLDSDFDGHLN